MQNDDKKLDLKMADISSRSFSNALYDGIGNRFKPETYEWKEISPRHYRLDMTATGTAGKMDFTILLGHFDDSGNAVDAPKGHPSNQLPFTLCYMQDVAQRKGTIDLGVPDDTNVVLINSQEGAIEQFLNELGKFIQEQIGDPKRLPAPEPL